MSYIQTMGENPLISVSVQKNLLTLIFHDSTKEFYHGGVSPCIAAWSFYFSLVLLPSCTCSLASGNFIFVFSFFLIGNMKFINMRTCTIKKKRKKKHYSVRGIKCVISFPPTFTKMICGVSSSEMNIDKSYQFGFTLFPYLLQKLWASPPLSLYPLAELPFGLRGQMFYMLYIQLDLDYISNLASVGLPPALFISGSNVSFGVDCGFTEPSEKWLCPSW